MSEYSEVKPPPDESFALPPDSVAFYVDYEEKRSRASTFFRGFSTIGLRYYASWWGIAAYVVLIISWFALLFTAKFPPALYGYLEKFLRYQTRVESYTLLLTDHFPRFSGNADQSFPGHFLIGPPKEQYSRWKTLLRIILAIPFFIVAIVLAIAFIIVLIVDWFVIVIMGEQPQGIQNFLAYCLGYFVRLSAWYFLLTEDWPKFSDESVNAALAAQGYAGSIPPASGAAIPEASTAAQPPAPPAPPAPPTPPTPPTSPTV